MEEKSVIYVVDNTEKGRTRIAVYGYGHSHYDLTREQLKALQDGKALAWSDGEYTTSIALTTGGENETA